jgi:hypothetical protein
MDPLEVIADAIMSFEGWKPGSRSYRNRNPGNLEGGEKVDAKNYDVFPTFIEGYQALLNELEAKFSGNNKHGIGPTSTMSALMNIYAPPSDNNPTTAYCIFICNWATLTLGRNIVSSTTLGDIWPVKSS